MSTLKRALRYGTAGFKVFPIKPGFKTPPLVKWGAQSSSDAATITKWWTKTPNANIGLACGQSGIAVIDIDTKEGRRGQKTIDMLEVADGLKLTPTRMQRTPSGGLQYFFRGSIPTSQNIVGKHLWPDGVSHVDTRGGGGAGGYVLLPGSVTVRDEAAHQFAGAYEWINPDAEIAPLDQWVIDLFAAHADIERSTNQADILVEWDKPDNVAWAVHYLENDSPKAIEGRGGELTTLKIAATLKDHAISEDKVLELMLDHWNERLIDPPQPPWECEELKVKVHNAFSYATGNAPGADTAEAEFSDMTEEEKQSYLKDDAEFRKTHGAEYTAKKKIAKHALEERIWTFSELCEEWVYITQMDRFVCRVDHDMIVKPEVFAKRFAYAKISKSPITTTMFNRKKNTIRRLDKAVFAPGAGEFVVRALNFYTQPDIAPAEGDTALWDSHLEYLLPNKIDRDHLLNWCAWLLQNIDKKPKHALLVAGHTQGTGKSYIAEVMARILGIANVNPIGALELSSSFNRWALNSKLLIVEELRAIDKREVAHKLHPIVTQELIPINDKGVATFKIENCFGILAMTNDDAAISLDNSDRRYLVIRTEATPRPVNYYGRLYGTLKDDKFIAAVAWQLIHRDLKGYDGQQRAPETEAKRDMIAAGRGEFEAWLDAESDNSPFNRDLVSINDDVFSVVPKRLERGASVMTRTIATFLKHQLNGKSFEDRHWLSDGRKVRLWALHGTYDELVKLSPAERAKLYETQRSVARASDATNTATEDFEP